MDRVVVAESLVSFGYLWNKAAIEEGFSVQQIENSFALCGLSCFESKFKDYKIIDKNIRKIKYAGNFIESKEFSQKSIQSIVDVDDRIRIRFVPEKQIWQDEIDDRNIEDCYCRISSVYKDIADNKKDTLYLYKYKNSKIDSDQNSSILKEVAGLILK